MEVEAFRAWARDAMQETCSCGEQDLQHWCDTHLYYQSLDQGSAKDYAALAEHLGVLERTHNLPGNRVLYLALPPTSVPSAVEALSEAGLTHSRGWVRVVIEKPFGYDFPSARKLNTLLHRYFDESQIYRIDHYLGKETVQNLLAFRFANPIFESLWNRDKVESVQVTVAENLGVEHRGAYYQDVGALRDMVQNHLTQLLTIVAMEIPVTFEADALQNEKLKVLHSIAPISPLDVIFGQYTSLQIKDHPIPGYHEEPGVRKDSKAETYAALKVEIPNWRWQGVPFYLRTGKRLPRKMTQIAVIFREARS